MSEIIRLPKWPRFAATPPRAAPVFTGASAASTPMRLSIQDLCGVIDHDRHATIITGECPVRGTLRDFVPAVRRKADHNVGGSRRPPTRGRFSEASPWTRGRRWAAIKRWTVRLGPRRAATAACVAVRVTVFQDEVEDLILEAEVLLRAGAGDVAEVGDVRLESADPSRVTWTGTAGGSVATLLGTLARSEHPEILIENRGSRPQKGREPLNIKRA